MAFPGYPREAVHRGPAHEHETEIRKALDAGAYAVQIDFTEGRLAVKLDPEPAPAAHFIDAQQSARWRGSPPWSGRGSACTPARAAIATRPTAPTSTTRELLPSLFELRVGQLLRRARRRARSRARPGVIRRTSSRRSACSSASSPDRPARRDAGGQSVRRVLEAAKYHPGRAARHDRRLRLRAVQPTTRRRRARRPLRRSARGSRAPSWRAATWVSDADPRSRRINQVTD